MPKVADDAAYLARLQDYFARWRSLPAYGPLQAVLGMASRSAVAKVSIDAWLVRYPSRTVLIPVIGDSMIDAGIHAGDVAVVERDTPARPGDRVIAVIDNEFTLKTLAVENGEAVLHPANPAYPVLRPGDRLQIFGVVVGLIRNYRRSS